MLLSCYFLNSQMKSSKGQYGSPLPTSLSLAVAPEITLEKVIMFVYVLDSVLFLSVFLSPTPLSHTLSLPPLSFPLPPSLSLSPSLSLLPFLFKPLCLVL